MKIELYLPAPPVKLSTNHRRRAHWADINDLTEKAKLVYGNLIRKQLPKELPHFNYARITFTLVVPNFKVSDPDNMSGMCKPILDAITERSGTCPLISDDSGKFCEVTYRIARGIYKQPSWMLLQIEEGEPTIIDIQPEGIRREVW